MKNFIIMALSGPLAIIYIVLLGPEMIKTSRIEATLHPEQAEAHALFGYGMAYLIPILMMVIFFMNAYQFFSELRQKRNRQCNV